MFLDVGLTRVRRHSSTSQPEVLVAEAFLASKSHDLRRRIGNVGPVYTEATSLGCDTAVTAVEIAVFFCLMCGSMERCCVVQRLSQKASCMSPAQQPLALLTLWHLLNLWLKQVHTLLCSLCLPMVG